VSDKTARAHARQFVQQSKDPLFLGSREENLQFINYVGRTLITTHSGYGAWRVATFAIR